MKKVAQKKLFLNRETVMKIQAKDLEGIHGGNGTMDCLATLCNGSACTCPFLG